MSTSKSWQVSDSDGVFVATPDSSQDSVANLFNHSQIPFCNKKDDKNHRVFVQKLAIPGKPRKVQFFLGNWIAGFRGFKLMEINSNFFQVLKKHEKEFRKNSESINMIRILFKKLLPSRKRTYTSLGKRI